MKIKKAGSFVVVFFALLLCNEKSGAEEIGSDVVLDSLSKYLSQQWGFPYTGFVGNGYLRIGYVYGYDQPKDYCDLLRFQRKGKKINVSLFADNLKIADAISVQTQRYLVQDRLASYISQALSLNLRGSGMSTDSFRQALKQVRLRFTVSRVAYPEASIIRQLQQVNLSSEISASSMSGFIVPHELLVISDFSYDADAAKKLGGDVDFGWLQNLRASLEGQRNTNNQTKLQIPDNSVAAFKGVPFPPAAIRCH